jgi:hypothetical protein
MRLRAVLGSKQALVSCSGRCGYEAAGDDRDHLSVPSAHAAPRAGLDVFRLQFCMIRAWQSRFARRASRTSEGRNTLVQRPSQNKAGVHPPRCAPAIHSRHQGGATANQAAACRIELPSATARTIQVRRSCDKGCAMLRLRPSPRHPESHHSIRRNPNCSSETCARVFPSLS